MAEFMGGGGMQVTDPTAQIDSNMSKALDLQFTSNFRFSMWQQVMAMDEKSWKILESVINDIKQ